MSSKFITFEDIHEQAKPKLSTQAYTYYSSGANDEITLRRNVSAFNEILFNPSVCVDVSKISLETKIFGERISMPLCVAPTAMQKLCHERGEINTVKACENKNVIMTLSSLSTTSMRDVADAGKSAFKIFQLYVTKNRSITEKLVRQAEQLGFKAIAVTVDAPVLGKRIGDERNKFQLPDHLKLEVLSQYSEDMKVQSEEGSGLLKMFSNQIDQSLNWGDIEWLKKFSKLPVILKGVQNYEDAKRAAQSGVHIWVSNHGGRQLDTVRSTIEMLPECVQAVKEVADPNIHIFVDGGIRKGTDVLKCLILGAHCVFVGRAALYANAVEGQSGIEKMLDFFRDEITSGMRLLGVPSVAQLNNPKYLVKSSIPKPNL